MAFIKKNCLQCNNVFDAEIREVNRGNGKFCSQSCSSKFNRAKDIKPEPNVICAFCSKTFYLCDSKQKNSKSKLYFCCRSHKDSAQKVGGIKEIMPPHYGTAAPDNNQRYRRIAFASKPKKCERCGYDQHTAAIIVHHKDRNRSNDNITNLEVLCCNCHAIEHWSSND